jgi:carboxylate-amine ligase
VDCLAQTEIGNPTPARWHLPRIMLMFTPPLTIGIEEEYQIIDPQSRGLTSYVQQLMNQGRVVLGDQLKQEFMRSQIEVGSHICQNI